MKNNSGKEDRFEEKEYFIQLKEFRTFTTTKNISIKHRLYLLFSKLLFYTNSPRLYLGQKAKTVRPVRPRTTSKISTNSH